MEFQSVFRVTSEEPELLMTHLHKHLATHGNLQEQENCNHMADITFKDNCMETAGVDGNDNSLIIYVEKSSYNNACIYNDDTDQSMIIEVISNDDTMCENGIADLGNSAVLNFQQFELEDVDPKVVDEYADVPGLIESPLCEDDDDDLTYDTPYLYNRNKRNGFTLTSEEDNLWMNSDYITCVQSPSVRTDTLDTTDPVTQMVVDEKDTLFGLGIVIGGTSSIVSDVNIINTNSDLNSYICTLENRQYDDLHISATKINKKEREIEMEKETRTEEETKTKTEKEMKMEMQKKKRKKKKQQNISDVDPVSSITSVKVKSENVQIVNPTKKRGSIRKKRFMSESYSAIATPTSFVKIKHKAKPKSRRGRKGNKNGKNVKEAENPDNCRFVCAECGKGFPRKSNHDSHIRMHLKVKPHKCSHCEKAFVRKSDLNRHERSLHWKTNFKCDGANWGCGHVYSRKDGLRKHWKTNQGVECLKSFLSINELQNYDPAKDIEKIIELTNVFK